MVSLVVYNTQAIVWGGIYELLENAKGNLLVVTKKALKRYVRTIKRLSETKKEQGSSNFVKSNA